MRLQINGRPVEIKPGTTVAAALVDAHVPGFAPLCAMGSCYQCRATIDGVPHCRACMMLCSDGMEVRTDGV
jgi:D-hydroxyproline dehydrogenase subunit gamma